MSTFPLSVHAPLSCPAALPGDSGALSLKAGGAHIPEASTDDGWVAGSSNAVDVPSSVVTHVLNSGLTDLRGLT